MTGFRGSGKTTLLSQLYYDTTTPEVYKLYLSVDQVVQYLNVSLQDILSVYEELIGTAFERLEKPVLLFLDEVQYDKEWALTLKTVFDRSKKVFIFCTGSSALSLQQNPDVARRAFTERLFSMSFTEYIKIKNNKFEDAGLAQELRKALYQSSSASEVHEKLKRLQPRVRRYWAGIEGLEVDRYMKYGTLPFAVKLKNEGLAYDQIKKIIDRVVSVDMAEEGQFRSDVMAKIPELLYIISASDTLSLTNVSSDLPLSRPILSEIISILEKTETIFRVYPSGSHVFQIRKPSKYLFASPAFRAMYYNFIGNVISENNYMGKLVEDVVGLYLIRYSWEKNYSITYDAVQGGADFIYRILQKTIAIEASYGEKDFTQVERTISRASADYGLVVSMSPLGMNESKTAVCVPLTYFLLT